MKRRKWTESYLIFFLLLLLKLIGRRSNKVFVVSLTVTRRTCPQELEGRRRHDASNKLQVFHYNLKQKQIFEPR